MATVKDVSRRTVRLSLAVTPEEAQALKVMATARQIDVSTLIRQNGVDEPVTTAAKLVAELSERPEAGEHKPID